MQNNSFIEQELVESLKNGQVKLDDAKKEYEKIIKEFNLQNSQNIIQALQDLATKLQNQILLNKVEKIITQKKKELLKVQRCIIIKNFLIEQDEDQGCGQMIKEIKEELRQKMENLGLLDPDIDLDQKLQEAENFLNDQVEQDDIEEATEKYESIEYLISLRDELKQLQLSKEQIQNNNEIKKPEIQIVSQKLVDNFSEGIKNQKSEEQRQIQKSQEKQISVFTNQSFNNQQYQQQQNVNIQKQNKSQFEGGIKEKVKEQKPIKQVEDDQEDEFLYIGKRSNDQNLKEEIEDLIKDIAQHNEGVEKKTMQIILETLMPEKDLDRERIDRWMSEIEELIKEQVFIPNSFKEILKEGMKDLNERSQDEASKQFSKALAEIQPLRVNQVIRLVDKTKQQEDYLINKKVLLLLGNTGVGKSTSIYFLSGQPMVEKKVIINQSTSITIQPRGKIVNKDLEKIKVGYTKDSETRYISPVRINMKDLGYYKDQELFFVDCPGSGDSMGAEVDIANGVGIMNAVKKAKEVVPIMFISQRGGDRSEGIKAMANRMVNMINDIEEHQESFFFIFTKFSEKEQVLAEMLLTMDSLKNDRIKSSDSNLMCFMNRAIDILQKNEEDNKERQESEKFDFKIDPLKGKPLQWLKKLAEIKAIQNPEKVFSYQISSDSESAITKFLGFQQNFIQNALSKNDFKEILFRLDQIDKLQRIVQRNCLSESISQAVDQIKKKFDEIIRSQIEILQDIIKGYRELSQNEVNRFKKFQDEIESASELNKKYLEEEYDVQQIKTNLKEFIANLVRSLIDQQQKELDCVKIRTTYHNIKMLQKEWRKEVEGQDKEIVQVVKNYLIQKLVDLKYDVSNFQLDHGGQIIQEMQMIFENLKIMGTEIQKERDNLDQIIDGLEQDFNKRYQLIVNSLKSINCSEDSIQKCKNSVEEVNSNVDSLKLFIDVKRFEVVQEKIKVEILNFFKNSQFLIQKSFESQKSSCFDELDKRVKMLDTLKEIKDVENRVVETYNSIIQNIKDYLKQLNTDAEGIIELISSNQKDQLLNYSKLIKIIFGLKRAGWLNKIQVGSQDAVLQSLKDEVLQHVTNLHLEVRKTNFQIDKIEEIARADEIVTIFEHIFCLTETIPQINQLKDEVDLHFNQKIQELVSSIQQQFNLENKDMGSNKKKLIDLKDVFKRYEEAHYSNAFLRKNDYSKVEDLLKEIEEAKKALSQLEQNHKNKATEIQQDSEKWKKLKAQYYTKINNPENTGQQDEIQRNTLKEMGYQDVEEFFNVQISLNDKELQENMHYQTQKETLEKEIVSKEEILQQYTKHSQNKEPCQDQKLILEKMQFKSIVQCQQEIIRLDRIVQYAEKRDINYEFENLNIQYTEDCIEFLKRCKQQNNTSIISEPCLNKILNYISEYGKEKLENKISYSFVEIINFNEMQKVNELDSLCVELSRIFKEILQSMDTQKYPEVNKLINFKQFKDQIVEFLQNQKITIQDILDSDQLDHEKKVIAQQKAKYLSKIEQILNLNDLYDLFIKNNEKTVTEHKEFYKKVSSFIEKPSFSSLASELMGFNVNPAPSILKKLKEEILIKFQQMINSCIKQAKYVTKSLAIDQIKTTYTELELIKEGEQKLKGFDGDKRDFFPPDLQQQIQVAKQEVKKILNEQIKNNINHIESQIKNKQFQEAEIQRENLMLVRHTISDLIEQDNSENINKLEDKLLEVVQEKVKEMINEDKTMTQMIQNPPYLLYEKIEKIQKLNICYADELDKLHGGLQNLMIKFMNIVGSDDNNNQKNNPHYEIVSVINLLPQKLKSQIELQYNQIKFNQDQKENSIKEEITNMINNEDHEGVSQKVKNNKLYESFNNNIKIQISQFVTKSIKQKQDQLKKSRQNKDYAQEMEAIQQLKNIETLYSGQSNISFKLGLDDVTEQRQKDILKIFSELDKFENIENSNGALDQKFWELIMFKDLFEEFSQNQKFQSIDYYKKLKELLEKMYTYFSTLSQNLQESFDKLNLNMIKLNLDLYLKHSSFIKKLNDIYSENFYTIHENQVEAVKQLNDTIQKLKNLLENATYSSVQEKCEQFFKIQVEQIKYEIKKTKQEVQQQLSKINTSIEIIKGLDQFKKQLPNFESFNENISLKMKEFENQIQAINNKTIELINAKTLEVQQYYELEQHFNLFHIAFTLDTLKWVKDIIGNKYFPDLFKKIELKIQKLIQSNKQDMGKQQIGNILIQLKLIGDNLSIFKEQANKHIVEIAGKLLKQKSATFIALQSYLEEDQQGIGKLLIQEYPIFQGQKNLMQNELTSKHGPKELLPKLKGSDFKFLIQDQNDKDFFKEQDLDLSCLDVDKIALAELHKKIMEDYLNEVNSRLKQMLQEKENENQITQDFANEIKRSCSQFTKLTWNQDQQNKILSLISRLFALWTVSNFSVVKGFSKNIEENIKYLRQPNCGQILAILRIFGFGYQNFNLNKKKNAFMPGSSYKPKIEKCQPELQNNFVEIGTGEGKSVILAIAAFILAILGFEVSIACYSEVLSLRDKNSFKQMCELLGFEKQIHYGTFNQLTERIINKDLNIRKAVEAAFCKNSYVHEINSTSTLKQVLLIDELDVFFDPEFYGNTYSPMGKIHHAKISALFHYIWKNKNQEILRLKDIKQTQEYKELIEAFSSQEEVIDEVIKDILHDLKAKQHEYTVLNGKIAYKDQDEFQTNIFQGYQTTFAYFTEFENMKIQKNILEENLFFGIKCGNFSYAEIVKNFHQILGVTGTLKTISDEKKNIMKNEYNIKRLTYMPSVFGENKRKFAPVTDFMVENSDDYYNKLSQEIKSKLKDAPNQRAVLVFFETKQELNAYHESEKFKSLNIQPQPQILSEELSKEDREQFVKRASTKGMVSFCTKGYGRGTDFISNDKIVDKEGGVHVILTFLPEDISEQIQIMGRTARQCNEGSFSMIILDEKLEKFLAIKIDEKDLDDIKKQQEGGNDSSYLINSIQKFNQFLESSPKYQAQINFIREQQLLFSIFSLLAKKSLALKNQDVINVQIKSSAQQHLKSIQLLEHLKNKSEKELTQYLKNKNLGAQELQVTRILALLDATGSMDSLLRKTQNAIGTMFERAQQILVEKGFSQKSFELQCVVYRDYDQGIKGILQTSSWNSDPVPLRDFMSKVIAKGGGDYEEAIEIGLQYSVQENSKEAISSIILIADAPAKTRNAIEKDRKKFGGEKIWLEKFGAPTDYMEQITILKNKQIPVNAFYLTKNIKTHFEEISSITKGQSHFLDINLPQGSEVLTELVTKQILSNVGKSTGKSNELVEEYQKKFKSYL